MVKKRDGNKIENVIDNANTTLFEINIRTSGLSKIFILNTRENVDTKIKAILIYLNHRSALFLGNFQLIKARIARITHINKVILSIKNTSKIHLILIFYFV